ncbi:FtsK/SpoIIIE family DNA translocase [Zavarzinella formosa]|uniref:FtsK/SpoIIIE family DNA translocase n=1 Tax=Zavarzinella formosa TaxID=360055 RepID=UPI00030FED7D|nr:DNA translocase FtsK [Zavarzinella formosa]
MSGRPAGTGPSSFVITLVAGGVLAAGSVLGGPSPEAASLPGLFPQPFGPAGHWLREQLIEPVGAGAYVFLVGWLALSITLFFNTSIRSFAGRFSGWMLLVACASLIADRAGVGSAAGPLAGPGGMIGAMLNGWLSGHFSIAGCVLVLVAGIMLGVLLAADHGVMALIDLICWTGATTRKIGPWARGRLRRKPVVPVVVPLPMPEPEPVILPINRSLRINSHRETKPDIDVLAPTPIPGVPLKPDTVPISKSVNQRVERTPPPNRMSYELPPFELLDEPAASKGEDETHLRMVASLLEKTFADFGLTIKVVGIHTGPVVTQYEIALETGLRVSRVTALSDDLALNLKVQSVRIVAPLPGRNTVGIEVPNEHRAVVRLKELINSAGAKVAKCKLPLLLGKDSEGRPLVQDMADMPHLLIAGRTGTGKSVCLNSIIVSLLLTRTPEECRLLMIDPKQVELAEYGKLPHLMHPVVTDNSKAEAILSWAVDKMEQRYELLRKARVRNIIGFNELGRDEIVKRIKPVDQATKDALPDRLPYIVIIVDEVGDLMMAMKKEVEGHIIRLAQKSRAAGIHLILTTQRPTVDVITGLIKSNLPARICFQVADRSNSRVVLDEVGAEKLLGKGDMLFLQPNTSTIVRAQGCYASDDEILRVVSHLEVEDPEFDNELLSLAEKDSEENKAPAGNAIENVKKRDALYEQAVEIVIREGRGSCSLLQRALGVGYGRAARLIDFMAEDGIVGTYNGAQARDVLYTSEQWNAMRNGTVVEGSELRIPE